MATYYVPNMFPSHVPNVVTKLQIWFTKRCHVPNVVTKFPITKILIFHRRKKKKKKTPHLPSRHPPPNFLGHRPINSIKSTAQLKRLKKKKKKTPPIVPCVPFFDLTSRVLWQLT
jgi:hypothetical protein